MLCAKDGPEGGWVRYFLGQDESDQPVYRLCEVLSEC